MSGESFEFDVVSCCGFIDVEKRAYFGHLKSFKKRYKFSSFANSQFKEKWSLKWIFYEKKVLAKTTLKQETSESFYTKIIRRTPPLIATLFSLPLQKLFLTLFKAIDVILERYFNLPALFIFLILIQKWVNKSRLWEEKESYKKPRKCWRWVREYYTKLW